MIRFYDISSWEEHEYFNTGGTRDKSVVESPEDGNLYYFKTSLKKKQIDYIYEFWSEIIASEIGTNLGLNILHYDVAWNKNLLGCLSKSMIKPQNEELQEGYKWLVGSNPEYDVNNKGAYTFQAIENLMKTRFKNEKFLIDIIRIIIFDSIIGNEDRHQENWGIIVSSQTVDKSSLFRKKPASVKTSYLFAPIYDSGSSMGRELSNSKIKQMLTDSVQLEAYINRGRSEIHWEGELHKIPQERKDFLIKLVSLRVTKLFELSL